MNALLVALGGALGAVLRYSTGLALPRPDATAFPWATLGVNLAGSLAIGLLAPVLARHDAARLLLITGVLGGFTTFSAFSLDALTLVQAGRPGLAALYIAGSVLGGLALCALGWRIVVG